MRSPAHADPHPAGVARRPCTRPGRSSRSGRTVCGTCPLREVRPRPRRPGHPSGAAPFTGPPDCGASWGESAGQLVGYAAHTRDFATWSASEYVHLDCLFISGPHRSAGWGQLLLDAVVAAARTSGPTEVQCRSPQGNQDTVRSPTAPALGVGSRLALPCP
ncbi:GNAT family N-acetyltransferase [Streptomyces sp. NPDC006617]|uniref:GNAT family N-acetyltransferase n=1 Tax=Streptomyces sp. NPDC006617 TaxID=3155354 RepID=UPI0033B4CFAC